MGTLPHLMIHRITVKRPTNTKTSEGTISQTLSTVYDEVPCMVQPASAADIDIYQRRGIQISHVVYFDEIRTFQSGDEFTYTPSGSSSSSDEKYYYKGDKDLIKMGRVQEVFVLEVK